MTKHDLNDVRGHIKWCRTRIAIQAEEQRDTKTKLTGNDLRCKAYDEHNKEMDDFV